MINHMNTLIKMLAAAQIPFQVTLNWNGNTPQVWYPSKDSNVCDVICHKYSYGGQQGLLEIMGLVKDDGFDNVEGWLTADEVFKRIQTHWEMTSK